MRDGKWEYSIRAYKPQNQGGGLALETVHATKVSLDIELDVFRNRMARNEIAYIEIIHHVEPFGIDVIYN